MKKIRFQEAISSRGNSVVNDSLNSLTVRGIKKSLAQISRDNLLSECPTPADCAAPSIPELFRTCRTLVKAVNGAIDVLPT